MRLDLIAATGGALIIGLGVGFSMGRAVYEADTAAVDPSPPPAMVCPKCAACPVCPPAPDCGREGLIPKGEAAPELELDLEDEPGVADPARAAAQVDYGDGALPNGLPGLPAKAMDRARAAIEAAIAPCLDSPAPGQTGLILLDTEVEAGGGRGEIKSVAVKTRRGEVSQVEGCVLEKAKSARFEWEGPRGALPLKVTVPVGNY